MPDYDIIRGMKRAKRDQSLHVTVTKADLVRLDNQVKREDTSRSAIVRAALRSYLGEQRHAAA